VSGEAEEQRVPESLLAGEELPSLPAVAVEVLRLCRRDDVTLDDLAGVIAMDPALAAKLLRYSNSSLFNLGTEVTTLQRAMLVLGLKSVQLMSLSFSLAGGLPRAGQGFDYDAFWRRSIALAVAARLMASLTRQANEDEAFLCGLLGEIGRLVLTRGHARYSELFAAERGWPARARECAVLGYHSGDVGGMLLQKWGLPETIHLGVAALHDPGELPADLAPEHRRLVEVLHAAHLAVEVLCARASGALGALVARAAERFNLGEARVEAYLLALEGAFGEAAKLLDLPLPTDRSHAEILAEARAAMLDVGLGATGQLRRARPDFSHRAGPLSAAGVNALTGLPCAQGFHDYVVKEVRARRASSLAHAFGILLVGLDAAKGKPIPGDGTDEAQRLVASVLRRMTRKGDVPAYLEAGLFGVLVPECSAFGLRTLAERIRIGVTQHTLALHAGDAQLTVSIGGGCIGRAQRANDGDVLLAVCRRYLARAREGGGNASLIHPSVIHGPAAAA
jgi:HD-like signal output (HDOD) protein/GGDEF domain-containing protein